MRLPRSARRTPSQRRRPRPGEPARKRWWQGLGLKTALIGALVPLVVTAAWTQGLVLVRAVVGPAPSASASPSPSAATGGPGSGPSSASPSHQEPEPSGDPTGDPTDEPDPTPTGGHGPKPSPTVKSPPPSPTGPVTVTDPVRRSGTLVMADYTAYDLDSKAADWNPTKDDWGPNRDVGYASWWDDVQNDAVVSREDPRYAASLPKDSGPWRRADCVRARYGEPSARPVGERLLEGRGICVVTSDGRYALLVVTRSVQHQLTVRVTVWE
ncbi:hypothetical protein ABGB16_06410 [Micromonospora sp. B11E3]|uniref:hypothetical protein n=1 Tax=Micromonospora sp. B11E3 TaxID=3153562 RepID=UPI00325DB77D